MRGIMWRQLRAAKPEEIETIKDKSDLTPDSIVLALPTPKGPILGVVRFVAEVDPVHYPEGLDMRWKGTFQREVETFLTAKGVNEYYFNLDADDASQEWRDIQEKFGAKKVFTVPTYRYKQSLVD